MFAFVLGMLAFWPLLCLCSVDPNAHVKYQGPVYDLIIDQDVPDDVRSVLEIEETVEGS